VLLVAKMSAIAAHLGAWVEGEEGERYDARGAAQPARAPGMLARWRRWWARAPWRRATSAPAPALAVGDRVRDVVGRWYGVVTRIDLRAEHGLGRISVRRDDGLVVHAAAVAHGLQRIAEGASDG
jgi:hypothetical protein